MENKKLFVGGYYIEDIREYEHEVFTEPKLYTMEEVIKLPFVEPMIEEFKNKNKVEFGDLKFELQKDMIIDYVYDDEIAGLNFCDTEEEAKEELKEALENLEEIQ